MEEVTCLVSSGDCVKIWDSASMTVLQQFNPHSPSHPVSHVCWSSNNQYLVSASSLGDKLVVSSLKSSVVPVLELAEGRKQTCASLNTSSQYLVSGGLDSSVNIWDLKNQRLHRSLKEHKDEVTCVSFNGSDSHIASGSASGDIILHNVVINLTSKAFGHGFDHPIHDLKYSVVKRSVLGSVADSGRVVLWDSNTQKELHTFDMAHRAPATGLAFSPTNDLLFVTVGLDKKIICYDTASKMILRSMRVESPLTAIDFTPDGTGLAVGSTHGCVYLYDLRNLSAPTSTASAHKTSVTCLRFQSSPNRNLKSSKSSKTSSTHPSKRISAKLGSIPLSTTTSVSTPPPTAPPAGPVSGHVQGQPQSTGAKVEVFREGERPQGEDSLPSLDRFSSMGRNSLDIFSPVREGYSMDVLSREAEGQHSAEKFSRAGRNSLDIFSPVREDLDVQSVFLGGHPHRKSPLGTPGGRCYSPLSCFQTPPPIKEEEPLAPATQTDLPDPPRNDENISSSLEGEVQTTPTSSAQVSPNQPALFFTPKPSVPANALQTQLRYDTPSNGTLATTTHGPEALVSSRSERGAENRDAPLTNVQIQREAPLTNVQIQSMIQDAMEDFRDAWYKDIGNLQTEMIRQFYIQNNELHALIARYSVNESLIEEIERLKEEIQRLRANY